MKFSYGLPAIFIGTAIALVQSQVAVALTAKDVNNIAKEITVLIDGQNPGSGVIIGKQGNTYYVLTAKHVVATEDEYKLVTPDGRRYSLDYSTVKKLSEVDLALLQFTSNQNYRTARLAYLNQRDWLTYGSYSRLPSVYIFGWPSPGEAQQESRPVFSPGQIVSLSTGLSDAYSLIYTNTTFPGMSGGPILDVDGRVVGIHGQGFGEQIYDPDSGTIFAVQLFYNFGIPISFFLNSASKAGVNLGLQAESSPPTQQTNSELITPLPLQPVVSNPTTPTAKAIDLYNHGARLLFLEDYQKALEKFNQAIKVKPDLYPAWGLRSQALENLKQYEEALASYNKALQIKPNSDWLLSLRCGLIEQMGRKPEEVLAAYDKALQFQPKRRTFIQSGLWISRGNFLVKLGRYEEAISSFEKAIKIIPVNPESWHLRGFALAKLKRYQEALVDYEKAIELEPNRWYTWLGRSKILETLNRYNEALNSYNKGIQFSPNAAFLWQGRGGVFTKLQRYEEAIASYDRAIQIAPNVAGVGLIWLERGDALKKLQRYEEAINSYKQATQDSIPLISMYGWTSMGITLYELKQYKEAVVAYGKALTIQGIQPFQDDVWVLQTAALRNLGRYEEALESVNKALEINPNNVNAQDIRKSLLRRIGR